MNLVLSPSTKFSRAHFTAYLLDVELLTANPIVIDGSQDDVDTVTSGSSWVAMASGFVYACTLHKSPAPSNIA
jgi:hypothetical protein